MDLLRPLIMSNTSETELFCGHTCSSESPSPLTSVVAGRSLGGDCSSDLVAGGSECLIGEGSLLRIHAMQNHSLSRMAMTSLGIGGSWQY